jgi:hypothetical protein
MTASNMDTFDATRQDWIDESRHSFDDYALELHEIEKALWTLARRESDPVKQHLCNAAYSVEAALNELHERGAT